MWIQKHENFSQLHRQLEKPRCTLCFRGMPALLLHRLGGGLLASLRTYDVNFVHRLLNHLLFSYTSLLYIDNVLHISLHGALEKCLPPADSTKCLNFS